MGDKGFEFEKRKSEPKENYFTNVEYGNGGDGGNFSRNGFVKSHSYSRRCYSDPNNPGKIICKEMNNYSGYNPFNPNDQKNNYQNSYENVYTKDYNNRLFFINNYDKTDQNPQLHNKNIWDKISSGFKRFFGSDGDGKPNDNSYTRHENFTDESNFFQNIEEMNQRSEKLISDFYKILQKDTDPYFNDLLSDFHPILMNSIKQNISDPNYNPSSHSKFPGDTFEGLFGFDDFFSLTNPDYKLYHQQNPQNFNRNNLNNYQNNIQQDDKQNVKFRDSKIYDV